MRRAQRRKYHYFYKTTCVITNRYYYGMHSTDNLDDGYVGSGKRLWYSINKHGRENHICEKLEFFDTREKLVQKEIDFVNEDLLKNPMCMNLHIGGAGGFSKEEAIRGGTKGGMSFSKRMKEDKEFHKLISERCRKYATGNRPSAKTLEKMKKNNTGKNNPMYGKNHSFKSKEKMKNAKSGENNPSFGSCWIYNIEYKESKRINKSELQLSLDKGWIKGRKIKF